MAWSGKRVSHYRVLEVIGGGGMGVVYKAEDLKLGRRVALKFLPDELANDPASMERFEREARAASALNHPNICTIHEVEEYGEQPFIVMELLEGQTLRDWIAGTGEHAHGRGEIGRIRLETLLDVAVQIAGGLEAAHQRGIIHRDIKPANIFITPNGRTKILDFGLAKLQWFEPQDQVTRATSEMLPTRNSSLSLTRTGVAMGTAGYMSPEQVRGEQLDARTDLFSFGVLLYEMATGQQAFAGETEPILRAAILNNTPVAVRQLNSKVPAKLEGTIRKALEKDRDSRYQSASEMRADLDELKRDIEPRRIAARRWLLAAGLALVALVVATAWLMKRPPPSPAGQSDLKQTQLTTNSSDNAVTGGAISPEGTLLAYADLRGIHVKVLQSGEIRDIPQPDSLRKVQVDWNIVPNWVNHGTEFLANAIPHGEQSSTWVVPAMGGAMRKVRDNSLAWTVSRDGSWVPFGASLGKYYYREIWLMRPDGSEARRLYEAGENTSFLGAEWSPNGQRLAYIKWQQTAESYRLAIESRDLQGGPATTAISVTYPFDFADWFWSPDGRIIYSAPDPLDARSNTCNFWQIPTDGNTGKPLEKPSRLTNWSGFCMDQPSVTNDGKHLSFRRTSLQSGIYLAGLQPNGTRITAPRRITQNEAWDQLADWTADGKSVVFTSNRNGRREIYKQAFDQDAPQLVVALPSEGAIANSMGLMDFFVPRVSPDGAWVLYLAIPNESGDSTPVSLMRVPIGGGKPELVLTTSLGIIHSLRCARSPATLCAISELTSDRKQLIFTSFDPVEGRERELLRYATEPSRDAEYDWDLSPDATRIAIIRRSESSVRLLSLAGRTPGNVFVKGADSLQAVYWAQDGKGLFITATTKDGSSLLRTDLKGNTSLLWEVKGSIQPSSSPFIGGSSTPWAVPSPDGRHLAICQWTFSANMWMLENF